MNNSASKFYTSADANEIFLDLIAGVLYVPQTYICDSVNGIAKAVRLSNVTHDMYCHECKRDSTFRAFVHGAAASLKTEQDENTKRRAAAASGTAMSFPTPVTTWTGDFTLLMMCTRNSHFVKFYFVSGYQEITSEDPDRFADYALSVTKVGQYPSSFDLSRNDLNRFKNVLSADQLGDLRRAMTTASHGFNVAACVYYRRVFEGLIDNAKNEHMQKASISTWEDFENAKTDQRIALLRNELPSFMIEHPQLYRLLSKGVHELTEQECAAQMHVLKESIELILEEQLIKKQSIAHRANVSKLISQKMNENN